MASGADFETLLKSIHTELTAKGRVQAVTEQFSRLTSDLERVSFVLRMEEASVLDKVLTGEGEVSKSDTVSEQLRNAGNDCFRLKEYARALELYTEAIMRARRQDSGGAALQLSLAFANRSAVFFHLQRYSQCRGDIRRALQNQYPAELSYKLYERLAHCQLRLGDGVGAERSFCSALRACRLARLDRSRRRQLLATADRLVCQSAEQRARDILEQGTDSGDGELQPEQPPPPQPSHGHHKLLTSASAAVDLLASSDKGRMLVANRDLQPGDVLISEPVFCSVLLPDQWRRRCYRCCHPLTAAVPCGQCCSVLFCSQQCRDLADVDHHSAECGLLDRLVTLDVGPMALLAVRLVTSVGLRQLRLARLARCNNNQPAGANSAYSGGDHDAVYDLVCHSERRTVADLFRRTVTAVCLARLLLENGRSSGQSGCTDVEEINTKGGSVASGGEHSVTTNGAGYSNGDDVGDGSQTFDRSVSLVVDAGHRPAAGSCRSVPAAASEEVDDVHELAAALLHYLQSLPCNAHEISEQSADGSAMEEIGAGVYPTVSLMNHACDPNVQRISYGTSCVVRVTRPVQRGQEILDNYGFHFAVQDWTSRQEALRKQYLFTCQCQACTEGWPLHPDIPGKVYIKCERCTSHPMYCYHEKNKRFLEMLDRSRRPYLKAMAQLKECGSLPSIRPLVDHLLILERLAAKPCREFNDCQEALKFTFFSAGNRARGSSGPAGYDAILLSGGTNADS